MSYTVEAKGICKSFSGHPVLDHVDLAVETGSVLALLGPNGAGKTTMVKILATLMRPDAGTATVAGHDLLTDPVGVKQSFSLTGQYAAVDEKLTGRENLEMMAQLLRLSRMEARARASELLAEFDLADAAGRRAAKYSGGMRRRLDLAISMIARPPLVFLDEPTTGLDPRSREQTWSTVRRLVDEGVTVLLTTQYLEEADQLADTVAVLDHGRVVAQGTPDELKAQAGRGSRPAAVRRPGRLRASARRSRPGAHRPPAAHHRRGHRGHGQRDLPDPGPSAGRGRARGQSVHLPPQPGRRVPVCHRRRRRGHRQPRRGQRCPRRTEGDGPMSMAYALTDSRVMVTRCVRRSLRDPEAFFTALMLPVVLMLLFVYVFGGAFDGSGAYVNYVVPGLIVLCAGFGAGTTAVAVATDMSNGIVDRFRSMPISGSLVLVGHVVASLARNLVATALVIGVGLAVGWRPTAGPAGWVAAAAMIVFFVLALSWLAAAAGLLAGSVEAANAFTFVIMFLPYVSTAFVPAQTLPSWMRGFAGYQPFTPIVETMRGLWMGHTSTGAAVGHEAWIACAWCAGILAVSFAAASWLFRHRTAA